MMVAFNMMFVIDPVSCEMGRGGFVMCEVVMRVRSNSIPTAVQPDIVLIPSKRNR